MGQGRTGERIHVLLVEDNPGDAELFRAMLGQSSVYRYETDLAERLSEATRFLARHNPDVILLDLFLPESKGLATLARVVRKAPHTPIVVLTKMDDERMGLNAVREGAQDYLVKGQVNAVVLGRAIHYAIERKLVSEKLAETTRQLERMDRLKSEFMSILSHDLRSPVASIIGSAETLTEGLVGSVDEKQRQILAVIMRKSDWMMRMLNDLLDLTRIEDGAFVADMKCLDLREPVGLAAEAAGSVEVALDVAMPDRPVQVVAEQDRIVQAIQNLLGNAFRFADSRVRLSLDQDEDRALIRVADDGPGVPPDELERVFQRYARSKAHKDKSQTGLGLAIVRAIADAHGGSAVVENLSDGKGTPTGALFTISLPLAGPNDGGAQEEP